MSAGEYASRVASRNLRRFHRKLRRLPRRQTPRHLADPREAEALQNAGRNRRAVAAGAVNQQWTIPWQFPRALGEMVERQRDASGDPFLFPLAGRAHVDENRFAVGDAFGCHRRTDALGCGRQVRSRIEAAQPVFQITDDMIEADSAEPNRRLALASGVAWRCASPRRQPRPESQFCRKT